MALDQFNLFGLDPSVPAGFRYQPNVVPLADEPQLVQHVQQLPFRDFEFQGFTGKRRVVSFGWRYDFNERLLKTADDMPPFLLALRETAAEFAGMPPEELQQVLVSEYDSGAGIGWHRDRGVFGQVVGISLLSPCVFRLRRKNGDKFDRFSLTAEPRSAYLLDGEARTDWEHSIPGVDQLRYSITFRNFR